VEEAKVNGTSRRISSFLCVPVFAGAGIRGGGVYGNGRPTSQKGKEKATVINRGLPGVFCYLSRSHTASPKLAIRVIALMIVATHAHLSRPMKDFS
jgi:hypothetical protein